MPWFFIFVHGLQGNYVTNIVFIKDLFSASMANYSMIFIFYLFIYIAIAVFYSSQIVFNECFLCLIFRSA